MLQHGRAQPHPIRTEDQLGALALPHRCSTVVYDTLGRCWSFEPSARPAFDALVEFFKDSATTAADNNLHDKRDTEGVLLVPSRSRQNDYVALVGQDEDSSDAGEGPSDGGRLPAHYGVVQPRHVPAEPQRHDTPYGTPKPAAEGGQADAPYGTLMLAETRPGDAGESYAPYGASRPAEPRPEGTPDEGARADAPHGASLPAGQVPGGGTLYCPARPSLVGQQVGDGAYDSPASPVRVDAPSLPAGLHAASSTPGGAARASHHANPYVDLLLRETTFGEVNPTVRAPFRPRVGAL